MTEQDIRPPVDGHGLQPMVMEDFLPMLTAELASLGGRMLAEHGDDGPYPNPTLASVGGYLLTYYGGTH